jgi:hypothetical protein
MKNNLKAIGILICLSIFGYGVYFVSSVFTKVNDVKGVEIESKVTENSVDVVEEVVFEDLEPIEGICLECEDNEELVLGDTDQCGEFFNEILTIPVSIEGSGNVNFRDGEPNGEMVSKNAKIDVAYITAPTVLLSGSSQVRDSNKLISMESASLKAAGNPLEQDQVEMFQNPDDLSTYKEDLSGTFFRKPFGTEVEMTYTENEKTGSIGTTTVETEEESICTTCQNSNWNPSEGNLNSEELFATIKTPTGGSPSQTDATSLSVDGEMVEDLPEAAYERVCENSMSVWERITAFFSSSKWDRCNTEDENGEYLEECINTESILIKTNSFFGDYNSCEEKGICMNTFMGERYLMAASPVAASSFDQHFLVTTPCGVYIDGKQYDVKCLWDMSYVVYEYEYQQQYNEPDSEYPTWQVYYDAIEENMIKRS